MPLARASLARDGEAAPTSDVDRPALLTQLRRQVAAGLDEYIPAFGDIALLDFSWDENVGNHLRVVGRAAVPATATPSRLHRAHEQPHAMPSREL